MAHKTVVIPIMAALLLLFSTTVFAEFHLEINEPLTNGQSSGNVRGGRFTEEGWQTTSNADYIQWDIETCAYGRVEFDVKGLYASNEVFPNVDETGDEDMHYTLFTMWDRDPNDEWYGKYINGVRQWHNPYKMVTHIFGYVVGDVWKWEHGRFRLNVSAFNGGYDDDPHAFEIEYGPQPWEKERTYRVKIEWGQGHMYYYIDDHLWVHCDYSSFGAEYAPPHHSMRIGSALKLKGLSTQGVVNLTYSNFEFYRNEDLTPPEVVSSTPADGSTENPLDSYIAITMSESLDPNSFATAFKIIPHVDGEAKMTGNTIYYELGELLQPNTEYTVHLSTEVKDFAGNAMLSPYEFKFRTGEAQPSVVEKYGIFEIPLVATGISSNKYKDVRLKGVFQGPTQTIEIDGFWNGGDIFKVRMAPTEVGTWTYSISGSHSAFSKSGSFEVIDSEHKGFVKVNPDYPYTFMREDGTPWLWKGETSWRAYTQLLPFEGRYKEYIDLRAEQGYNAVQSIVVSYINGDAFWANEGGTAFKLTGDGKDYDHLNPGYYQWIDRRLEYANSKGIVPVIFFTWAQEFVKFSDDQFQRFAEYLVSRWAAYDVVWCISGEYNEAYDEYGLTPDVYRQHGETIMEKDPYDHLVTLHPSGRGSSREFAWDEWFGFIMQQWPIDYHQRVLDDRNTTAIPVVNGEYAYADWHDNEDVRRGAWDIFTAGGFFTAGFFHTFAPDKGGWDPDANQQQQDELVWAIQFMGQTEWWDMAPHDELASNGYCLADPGDEYVIYSRDGGPTTINLSAVSDELNVRWLNPRTGEYVAEDQVSGGSVTFTPPWDDEWVLHIGVKSDGPPAAPTGFTVRQP